jgi:hypothetical protein
MTKDIPDLIAMDEQPASEEMDWREDPKYWSD